LTTFLGSSAFGPSRVDLSTSAKSE
jgi:hypothetical protein